MNGLYITYKQMEEYKKANDLMIETLTPGHLTIQEAEQKKEELIKDYGIFFPFREIDFQIVQLFGEVNKYKVLGLVKEKKDNGD